MNKGLLTLILFLVVLVIASPFAKAGAFYDDPPAKSSEPTQPPVSEKKETDTKPSQTLETGSVPAQKETTTVPDKTQSTPAVLSGKITSVLKTATIRIQTEANGKNRSKQKKIVLFGLENATGNQVLGDLIILFSAKGGHVRCMPAEQGTYRCQDDDGADIGKAAVRNGIARVLSSAPPEYKEAESEAMKSKVGIWR